MHNSILGKPLGRGQTKRNGAIDNNDLSPQSSAIVAASWLDSISATLPCRKLVLVQSCRDAAGTHGKQRDQN